MSVDTTNLPEGIGWMYPHDVSRGTIGETESGLLFIRGDDRALLGPRPRVGIVGSRAATAYGMSVAGSFASVLAMRGVTVVSGGAYGIDAAAHRGALPDGRTICVLACGADRVYPAAHKDLINAIATSPGSAVVSGVEPGAVPMRSRFLARNGIIAGMVDALIVVEASLRSGAMNAATHAIDRGVPVYAVPGPITSVASAGTHLLIADGRAKILTDVHDLDLSQIGA